VVDTSELNIESGGSRRIIAALCHFSGIIPVYGAVFSAVVWLWNRRCDRPVAFQALQALIAQIAFHLLLLIPFLGWIVMRLLWLLRAPMPRVVAEMNHWFVELLFVTAWVTFVFATFQVYLSGKFEYPLLGKRIAAHDPPPETRV
jgi:uncharacterized Tic20 family protein